MSILSLNNISKNFGAIEALNKVSLTLNEGQVVGLMGDNGAGKSTLIKIIAGVFQATSGEILYNSQKVNFTKPIEARNSGIEVVYQDLALCDNLTAAGNIFLSKELFKDFLFIENVRSGEDLEWKRRIKKNITNVQSSTDTLTYTSFPSKILSIFFKFFIYSLNAALIDVQNNLKDIYLSLFIILSVLIIPRWNYLVSNWEESAFYIPNVTKLFFLTFLIFLFFIVLFKKFTVEKLHLKYSTKTIYYSSLIVILPIKDVNS